MIQKSLLSIFILSINISIVFSQNYEGKITYQNTYTSNIPNMTSEQFNQMMGTVQDYYVKGANYKSEMNGSFSQWQLYVPSENRLYNKLAVSDTVLWSDDSSNPDEAVSYELKKSEIEILGYECDALVVKTKTGNAITSVRKLR